jgi:hypothetical protein
VDTNDRNGRPRSGADRRHRFPRRQHRVYIRFDTVEHRDLIAAASRIGLTVTGFCADAAVAAARGTTPPGKPVAGTGVTRHELAALQRELFAARTAIIRTGTNLNQAVAAFHVTGQPPVWLAHAVHRCAASLDRLEAVVDRIDRRLR